MTQTIKSRSSAVGWVSLFLLSVAAALLCPAPMVSAEEDRGEGNVDYRGTGSGWTAAEIRNLAFDRRMAAVVENLKAARQPWMLSGSSANTAFMWVLNIDMVQTDAYCSVLCSCLLNSIFYFLLRKLWLSGASTASATNAECASTTSDVRSASQGYRDLSRLCFRSATVEDGNHSWCKSVACSMLGMSLPSVIPRISFGPCVNNQTVQDGGSP